SWFPLAAPRRTARQGRSPAPARPGCPAPGRGSRPGKPACRAAWGRWPGREQPAPPSSHVRLRWRWCVRSRLPLLRPVPHHVVVGPDLSIQVLHDPLSHVANRAVLEKPPAFPAGVDEKQPAVEHPAPGEAEIDQEGRLVAIEAERCRRAPPRRL